MNRRLIKLPDRREWDLSGFLLDQIRLDYALTLFFAHYARVVDAPQPSSAVTVVIETPCILRVGSETTQINPEVVLFNVPVLPLLHQPAASLTAFRTGTLLITFANGAELEVPKHEQYKTWKTFGEGEVAGASMECLPYPGPPWVE